MNRTKSSKKSERTFEFGFVFWVVVVQFVDFFIVYSILARVGFRVVPCTALIPPSEAKIKEEPINTNKQPRRSLRCCLSMSSMRLGSWRAVGRLDSWQNDSLLQDSRWMIGLGMVSWDLRLLYGQKGSRFDEFWGCTKSAHKVAIPYP